VVRDLRSGRTVGACRVVTPRIDGRADGYRAERLFDMRMLEVLRARMVELGGPCIDRDCRTATIMQHLGTSLARYLVDEGYDFAFGCAAVSLADGGHAAASAFRTLSESHLSPIDLRARPRLRLPLESLREFLQKGPPPVLRAYVELGAWICGEPALDAANRCAVFPLLLPLARMRVRYARQFLARAA
jgi:putative hemolysin